MNCTSVMKYFFSFLLGPSAVTPLSGKAYKSDSQPLIHSLSNYLLSSSQLLTRFLITNTGKYQAPKIIGYPAHFLFIAKIC